MIPRKILEMTPREISLTAKLSEVENERDRLRAALEEIKKQAGNNDVMSAEAVHAFCLRALSHS